MNDRVRAALRGEVEAHRLFDALEIALEALEQYDLFSPLWAGQPTRASVAIERMADVLEGRE